MDRERCNFARVITSCLFTIVFIGRFAAPASADEEQRLDSISVLRGLVDARSATKPFRTQMTITWRLPDEDRLSKHLVEYGEGRYRITTMEPGKSVVIFDGEKLLCYDGRDSAVITSVDKPSSETGFDPRILGISPWLRPGFTFRTMMSYRSATDMVISDVSDPAKLNLKKIALTDKYKQRIEFIVQAGGGFRVHQCTMIIPAENGGVHTKHVVQSEFWDGNQEEWLPRKITINSYNDGDINKNFETVIVEMERPERPVSFDDETWTIHGLSLPDGQAVADLRIMRRIGYWRGGKLTEP